MVVVVVLVLVVVVVVVVIVIRIKDLRGRAISLSQQLVVRALVPGWRFSNEQKDCSELVLQMASACPELWARWEFRVPQADGFRVMETGASPILLAHRDDHCRTFSKTGRPKGQAPGL